MRRSAGGPVRRPAPDHLPGGPAAGHAAPHHLQQPHPGAAAARAQLPVRPGVPGLQQQLPDRGLAVHFWEPAQASLPGPVLQRPAPGRGPDIRAPGEPGDAEDDRQPAALRDPPGRLRGERSPSGGGREPEQPDGVQHQLPAGSARPALRGAQREPLELPVRQRGPQSVAPPGELQVPRCST